MKILLISDMPPCDNFPGALFSKQLCNLLPPKSIYGLFIRNKFFSHIFPSPAIDFIDAEIFDKPLENSLDKHFGTTEWYSFIYESYQELITSRKFLRRVQQIIAKHAIEKIWIILEGQTMIYLARHIINHVRLPCYVQIWDEPKWWLIDNKIKKYASSKILNIYAEVIRKSSCCGVASDNMNEYYKKVYKNPNTYTLIPTFDVIPDDSFKITRETKSIYIGFCGQIYATDEWNCLLLALEKINWKLNDKHIYIHYAGNNLNGFSHPNVINYGYITQEQLFQILTVCDLVYCPYIINPKYREISQLSFPSKLVSYLAVGLPVFFHGPEYAEPYSVVSQHEVGVVCDSLLEDDVLEKLKILLDPDKKDIYSSNARDLFSKKYSKKSLTNIFFRFLEL